MTYFTPDEFSLQLSWSPRVNGVTPATPGFYLRAQFANEGVAKGVVRGSWDDGRAGNGVLVDSHFLKALMMMLGAHGFLVDGMDGSELAVQFADFQDDKQEEALAIKRAKLAVLKREVAELEASLESA